MAAQGVSRSESEMAQKSWPTGAPARAAAAWNADTPGTTVTATRLQSGRFLTEIRATDERELQLHLLWRPFCRISPGPEHNPNRPRRQDNLAGVAGGSYR